MSSRTKKETQQPLLEDARNVRRGFENAEQFMQKNRNQLLWGGGIIGFLFLVLFAYRYYQETRNQEAERELFNAVYYFEEDSLQLALEGDGINYGFLQIIEEYNRTNAENLAHFYAGVCYLKTERYTEAIDQLEAFSSSDWLISARAESLLGDAYMEQEQYEEAAEHYEEATQIAPNPYFSPNYLKKLALAQEQIDRPQEALNTYRRILEEYYESPLRPEAEKQIGRLKAMDTTSNAVITSF